MFSSSEASVCFLLSRDDALMITQISESEEKDVTVIPVAVIKRKGFEGLLIL